MSRRRFAKRNASVESPREVPLHIEANASFFTPQDALLAANPSPSPVSSPPHSPSPSRSPPNDDPSPPVRLPPGPRPNVLIAPPPQPLDPSLDRYSTGSLPLPSQIPYHTLLKAPRPICHPPMRCPPIQDQTSSDSTSSSGPSSRSSLSIDGSNPTTQSSRSSTDPDPDPQAEKKVDDRVGVRQADAVQVQLSQMPASPKSPSPQHQVTMNDSPLRAPKPTASSPPQPSSPPPPPPVTNPTRRPIQKQVPPPRPVSPFRAPMPPPTHQSRTSAWADHGTAMRRFMTPAQLQHAANSNSHSPFPPARAPRSPVQPPSSSSPPFGFASASSSSSRMYQQRPYPQQEQPSAIVASSASSIMSYPPPDPPMILPGDTEDGNSRTGPSSHMSAPYATFLSCAPQPADTWIRVETSREDYKLNIRLPGFDRDSITLATKRRRILHIMADSWAGIGGHFERRISFGYDADLGHVRAEFDGEMLHITVPRRDLGVTWSAPASNSGRARI